MAFFVYNEIETGLPTEQDFWNEIYVYTGK